MGGFSIGLEAEARGLLGDWAGAEERAMGAHFQVSGTKDQKAGIACHTECQAVESRGAKIQLWKHQSELCVTLGLRSALQVQGRDVNLEDIEVETIHVFFFFS